MSITLYREGLPRVEIKAGHIDSREGMLVGLVDETALVPTVYAVLMLEDGTLTRADLTDFRIQFHYDAETDRWVDENDRPVEPVEDP